MSRSRYFTLQTVCLAAALMATFAVQAAMAFGEESAAEKQKKLIAVLESKDAPPQDKAITCKRLALCGDKDAVPALVPLLSDEKLAAWARIALEAIPDPAVDESLLAATSKLQGRLLVGVINSIGVRRSPNAVDTLANLLNAKGSDAEVAAAAAVALGSIGDTKAAGILEKILAVESLPMPLRSAVAEGCILCAERSLKAGNAAEAVKLYDAVRRAAVPKQRMLEATRGAILARKADGLPLLLEQLRSNEPARFELGLRVAREFPGSEATAVLVAELDRMTPERQALMVLALTDRGDRPPLAVVAKTAAKGPKPVRIAAMQVLQRQGDGSCVPVLLAAAAEADAELSDAAAAALAEMPGKDVNADLAARLPKAEGKTRLVLIELVGQRRIAAAVPLLLAAADDADAKVRSAALKSLGDTIDFASLPSLVERLVKAKTPEDMAVVAEALKAASGRMPDREACAEKLAEAMPRASAQAKCKLLESLGATGGPKALAAIAEASKDANADVQGAAIQQLGAWMTPDAAPALLELAKNSANDKLKVRALRGYLRIARQFVMPAETRLAMFNTAMEIARRDEEKRIALDVLTRIPSKETLALATARLSDPKLRDAAADAAVKIAAKLVAAEPKAAAEAMQKVLDSGIGDPVKGRAKQILDKANAGVK